MGDNSTKTAGASYIIEFHSELNLLNRDTSAYINYVGALNSKYDGTDDDIPEDELNPLIALAQSLKNHIFRTFIMSQALARKVPDLKSDQLRVYYDNIKPRTIPNIEDIELYAIEINSLFCSAVVGDLLINANNFIGGLKN